MSISRVEHVIYKSSADEKHQNHKSHFSSLEWKIQISDSNFSLPFCLPCQNKDKEFKTLMNLHWKWI